MGAAIIVNKEFQNAAAGCNSKWQNDPLFASGKLFHIMATSVSCPTSTEEADAERSMKTHKTLWTNIQKRQSFIQDSSVKNHLSKYKYVLWVQIETGKG